jgi:hypothetical protein
MTEPVTQKSTQSQLLWALVRDIADLKASARAKLVAGEPLTEEEASVLVI